MSQNKLISIKAPVLEALEDMGIEGNKDIPTITRWVARAENKIGTRIGLRRKIVVLEVKHCCAELPCETNTVQSVILGDYGNSCTELFDRCYNSALSLAANATDTFLVIDKPDPNVKFTIGGLKYEIQDNTIVLSSQMYHGKKITTQILCMETDSDGFPKIIEGHVEACVEYAMWRFAKRSLFSPNRMDLGTIDRFKIDWEQAARAARAEDGKISQETRDEIVAMLHNPWSGFGLEAHMYGRNRTHYNF